MVVSGCRSPYYADRGAFAGGLTGAGVGALVGNAVGSTGAGAAIGAGVGAITGGAIGGALDDIEARNRAQILSQLERPVAPGRATVDEVVAMTRAGVNPQLIRNYVNNSGMAQPIGVQDVIFLTQQGVPPGVIQAMQTPRVAQAPPDVMVPPPGPVIFEEHYYGPPPDFHHPPRCGPRIGWGICCFYKMSDFPTRWGNRRSVCPVAGFIIRRSCAQCTVNLVFQYFERSCRQRSFSFSGWVTWIGEAEYWPNRVLSWGFPTADGVFGRGNVRP
jgi:hypothetical protein